MKIYNSFNELATANGTPACNMFSTTQAISDINDRAMSADVGKSDISNNGNARQSQTRTLNSIKLVKTAYFIPILYDDEQQVFIITQAVNPDNDGYDEEFVTLKEAQARAREISEKMATNM